MRNYCFPTEQVRRLRLREKVKGPGFKVTQPEKWWSHTGLSGWVSPEAALVTKASTLSMNGKCLGPRPFTLLPHLPDGTLPGSGEEDRGSSVPNFYDCRQVTLHLMAYFLHLKWDR